MSGLPGWNVIFADGLYEQSAGIAAVYLCGDMQGFLSSTSDSPANTPFLARIKNADTFFIDYQMKTYIEGGTQSASSFTSFAQLEIDNSRGEFNYLIGADCRDAVVVLQVPFADPVGSLATAPVVATAALDNVQAPNPSTIILVLKDIISTYDRPMRLRRVPGYADAGAVGKTVPLWFGACRNVEPLLIDSPNRLYLLDDGVIANVVAVRDKGAALDPYATPAPQYVTAINGSGLQLAVLPQGALRVDASDQGVQAIIPGVADVLAGAGLFNPWPTPTAAPTGWTWSALAGSSINRLGLPSYPVDFCAQILSAKTWAPLSGFFGDNLKLTGGAYLKSGRSYRINFQIRSIITNPPSVLGGLYGGIMLRTALNNDPRYAVTPHGIALSVPLFGHNGYSFQYRVPVGADLNLLMLAVGADGVSVGAANGVGGGVIFNLTVEEIGQSIELPLIGISLATYWDEILYSHAGDSGTWNTTDLTSLDAATGYLFGNHYTEAPTYIQALRDACPTYCAEIFVDKLGQLRMKRLVAPEDATVVAAFDQSCFNRETIVKEPFYAEGLTTRIGVKRNWNPYQDGDYITDTDLLTADQRVRFKQTSQYYLKSTVNPALRYQHADSIPALESLLDDTNLGQIEINRVNAIFAPRIYNGALTTGERNLVTFDVTYDDFVLGIGPSVAPQDLLWGDCVSLTSVEDGFNATPMIVLGKKFYPYARKMTITGMY